MRNKVINVIAIFKLLLGLFNKVLSFLFKLLSNLYTEFSIAKKLIFGKFVISRIKGLLVLVEGERIEEKVGIFWIARSYEAWVFKEFLQVIFHIKYNNSLGIELMSTLDS